MLPVVDTGLFANKRQITMVGKGSQEWGGHDLSRVTYLCICLPYLPVASLHMLGIEEHLVVETLLPLIV